MLYLHKKYISLQNFCNMYIFIYTFFEWDNNCVVHLKAFYSTPESDVRLTCHILFSPGAFLFLIHKKYELAKYITYR